MAENYTSIFNENDANALAVASREGNNAADTEFARDVRLLPIQVFRRKYGDEAASAKDLFMQARDEQFRISQSQRNVAEVAADTGLGVAAGFVGVVGAVEAGVVGAAGAVDEFINPENTGLSEFATRLAQTTDTFTGAIRSLQSDELQDRQGVSGIEAQLDAADNQEQYDRETNNGDNASFIDDLAWFGRGTLNNAGRVLSDGAVAADVISQGIGSLGPSAKIASVASNLVTRTTTFQAAKIANAVAPTQGTRFLSMAADAVNRSAIAAGVGLSEGAGVYTATVNEVLRRSHGSLLDTSEEYAGLIESGVDPDDAKATVASHAGMDAFGRQFPTAMAFGLITARFEAAPISSFRGSGIIGGFRSVGAQTLEEGGQGLTGRLNQNIAIRDRVDPTQEISEGIDEEFAVGAIAGTGMSGVLATPAAIGNTPRTVINAARDISGSQVVSKLASAAATGVDGISRGASAVAATRGGQAVVSGAKTATSKVADVAAPVVQRATDAVEDFNDRPDIKIQSENLDHVSSIAQLSDVEMNTPPVPDAPVKGRSAIEAISRTPTTSTVSAGFKANVSEGGTVLDNVAGVMTTFAQKGFRIKRMSDEDTLYASEQFTALRNQAADLPVAIRNKVKKILSSPDFKAIQKRVKSIDLNTSQTASTSVTDQTVAETKAVAKTNPANVNPDVVTKILEQDDRTDLTDRDVVVMTEAKNISLAFNTRIGDEVEFVKAENIELKRIAKERGDTAKLKTLPENVTRNIAIGSDVKSVPGIRSAKDFVSDIFVGSQNENGKFIDERGFSTDVKNIGTQFNKFAQHMINKIDALNLSYDGRNANGRGSDQTFTGLVDGKDLVENGGKRVVYQSGSPANIRFARVVHADAVMVVEAYNATVRAFPESFPDDGELSVSELRGFETQTPLSDTDVTLKDDKVDETVTPQDDISEEASTTAVEEEPGAVEAQAETVSGSDETQDAPNDLALNETRTQEEFDAMSDDEILESVNLWEEDVQNLPMNATRVKQVMDVLFPVMEKFNLPLDIIRRITWLKSDSKSHLGQAYWAERVLSLKPSVVKNLIAGKDEDGNHVAYHELMHLIDAKASDVLGETASMSHIELNAEDGDIYAEVEALINSDPEMAEYFSYALSFKSVNEVSSELFAEIGAFMLMVGLKNARKVMPKGTAYVEQIIQKAGGEIETVQRDSASEQSKAASEADAEVEKSITDKDFSDLNPQFTDSFLSRDVEISYGDGQDILNMVAEQSETESFIEFADIHLTDLMAKANERLATMKTNKDDDLTIKERVLAGEDTALYRRNKNTIMVDQTTGEYDADLLSIAAVAVLDWLTSVRSSNPSQLRDTMEDMGLSFSDLSGFQVKGKDGKLRTVPVSETVENISFGVPPRETAETLAKTIVRMWGLRVNKDIPMVDARGAAEGMAKELLESLIALETNLIQVTMVPYFDKDSKKLVSQAMYNVRPMQEMQQAIGLTGQGAVTKMLSPEFDTMPSIGAKIEKVDQTQSRGDIPLSTLEKTALKNMQDTPHILADGFSNMVSLIGFDALADYLGRKSSDNLGDRHPLRASIDGKNLSIERDFQEAQAVVDVIRNSGFTLNGKLPPVYYKIGISKVGRHQFKGINPQNNKILRAMVTPTHALLDMTSKKHKDAFWLTVAQAADISGFNKVENQKHKFLLANIQNKFDEVYGDAVEIVEHFLETGEMDGAALTEAMGGSGEMQQLAAVFAVAGLNKATADGTLDAFNTTLSFELDGKTDGPANMMSNFGQGILTIQDYENFKRVGFFLGTKLMTLNKYFEDGNTNDLYETTSDKGVARLYSEISNAAPGEKDRLYAMSRFATAFGDLKYVDGRFEMTRTTAKNPMTKTVYGSSERGVGQGLANDMVMAMYQELINNPDGMQEYVGGQEAFEKDFEMLFQTPYPKNVDWNKSFLDKTSMEAFTKLTTSTLGKILSDTAKAVIGDPITEVNDTLVLMTAFQTEFLTAKFEELLEAKLQQRVTDGKISLTKDRTLKNGTVVKGKPNRQQLTQRDYDEVIDQIREYSPTYANGMQTLDIGSLTPSDSGIKLSEAMDGALQMASSMISPDLAGVKAIPYITQGRGDAMMMNRIYGGENAPTGTLNVFDGIDMGIDKISDYAQTINQSVLANWDADVLGDIVRDFTGFFEKTAEDGDLLLAAWGRALEGAKKKRTTSTATTPEALVANLHEMHRLNQARKTVFRRIGLSVDHMGGSDSSFVRGPDAELTLGQINNMISEELGIPVVQDETVINPDGSIDGTATEVETDALQIEDKRDVKDGEFSELVVTNAETVMDGLLRETKKKHVQATVRVLQKSLPLNTRIVIGSPAEVTDWYTENVGQMEKVVIDKKGIYDPANNVLLITDNNHETLTHELIHASTFGILEEHFNSGETNDTVSRLDTLMSEFMGMDFSKDNKRVQDAVNSAKAQILVLQAKTDAFSKAAAMNEFMAWTLSNEALMKELKVRPTGIVARLTKVVKALMQRLLGGVPTTMFENILFNTELLITGQGSNDGGNNNDGNDGGELTPTAHRFTNFWIDLARQRLDEAKVYDGSRAEKAAQFKEYRKNAKDALKALNFGGFNLDAYQKETFAAIHTVMALEMRLDTQSSIALNDRFEFITDNLTPEMFGPKNAQDRFSTIMDLFGASKNDEDISDAIAVLLALSQTSDGFRRALDQLPTPPENAKIDTSSLNGFLGSVTGMLMNKAVGSIDTADGDVKATLDALSESIILEDSEKEFRVLAGLMQNINKADAFLSGGFKLLAEYTEDMNREVQEGNRTRLTKIISGSITSATAFLDQDRAEIQGQALKRVTHMGNILDWAVPVREFVSEMVGTDVENQKLVALLDRTNFAVSSVRQNFREDLPIILQDEFLNHPDESQWKATHAVLGKTDFAQVFSLANADSSFRLISDEVFLDKKIAQSEAAVKAVFNKTVAGNILEKGQQLADYQNGNGPGFQLWKNAFAINKMAGNYNPSMTAEIDKLVSYYAIKGSDAQQRIQITEMYKVDPEAMKSLVVYSQALNLEEDLKEVSDAARMNGYKGFIPDQGQKGSKTIIADDDNRTDLEKQGYIRVGDATADENFSLKSRGYYTTTTKQTGTYSQGIMQTVQDTYKGVDATTGLTVNGTTSGVIAGDAVETITHELNTALSVSNPKEVLIPVFDDEGVMFYERAINPDILSKYQAPKSNMALMLGSWAGRQVEEKFAQQYNAELVTELKRIYDNRGPNDDDLYVNLPAEAKALEEYNAASKVQQKRMRKPDAVFVESWNVISPQTKKAIEAIFGEGNFSVRKDQMNLSLGYRDPSIIDMWTGDTRIPKAVQEGVQALSASIMGKTAMRNMAAIEGGVQGVVSTAKDLIVVRSLVVPYMNTQANIFQLQTRGIPIKQMWNAYPNKLAEIEQFNANVKKIMKLDTQIQLAGTDKNRVAILQQQKATIEGQNKRFSIAPLIEAGAYKNISEGITELDVDLTSGRIGEWVENQTNKLPRGVQTIAKYGLLSKDTALYKGANKAVQYGDFIAKAIYYDHLLSEKGLDHDAAMKLVNEEFVNFSVLPGRTRSYMESIGATWFLTFKIRIAKIAINQIRENPVRSLITGASGVDGPIGDNLATVIAEDRIGYSLGWEMLFGAAGLNPWLNVTDWADIR